MCNFLKMYYVLDDGVYLVKGFVKGCIYDFKHQKLYGLSKDLCKEINEINLHPHDVDEFNGVLKGVLLKFVKLGILSIKNEHKAHDISEIRSENNDIRFAWIEVTDKCNLQCRHCYNESSMVCNKIMSLSNFRLVIDCLIRIGVKNIQIIGGELLIIGDLLKSMLDYAIGKFNNIEIFTNGTLVTEKWIKYFFKNDIAVALSVYSYKPSIHDAVTKVRGSCEKTNRCIEMLSKAKIRYRVANILMKGVEIGKKTTTLYNLSETHDVIRMSGRANFSLITDDLIRKKLITKKTFSMPITVDRCRRFVSGHNCFKNKVYIASNLEVFPCAMERRVKHCTVDKHKGIVLNEVWCNLSKDKIEVCEYCEYRYACHDCRPNSLADNFYAKPWFCTYNPFTGEWIGVEKFIDKLHKTWG